MVWPYLVSYHPSCALLSSQVVIAAGALTPAVVSLIHPDLAVHAPVVPVVGQMFATERVPPASTLGPAGGAPPALRHLVGSLESAVYWATHRATRPPRVTHERRGPPSQAGAQGSAWGPRLTRHLYGKQTSDGRFLFGGDRRVHPPMAAGAQHPLPRVVPDMHGSVHAHACEVVPALRGLRVEREWGGVMPFSPDDRPIIGPLPGAPPGVFLLTGLGPSGFMRGPMAGLLLAESMVGDARATGILQRGGVDPARFALSRK